MSVRIGRLQIGFDFAENAQAFCKARAAKGFHGGAVSFVVGGFENVRDAAIGGNLGDFFRHFSGVGFVFNDARSGYQKERVAESEAQRAESDVVSGIHGSYRR